MPLSKIDKKSLTLLGSLNLTSGASQTLSGLDLTNYNFLIIEHDLVSASAVPANFTLDGKMIGGITTNQLNTGSGIIFLSLQTGFFFGTQLNFGGGVFVGGDTAYDKTTSALIFATSNGVFDGAGVVNVYGG